MNTFLLISYLILNLAGLYVTIGLMGVILAWWGDYVAEEKRTSAEYFRIVFDWPRRLLSWLSRVK
jgi:hypothetical protein